MFTLADLVICRSIPQMLFHLDIPWLLKLCFINLQVTNNFGYHSLKSNGSKYLRLLYSLDYSFNLKMPNIGVIVTLITWINTLDILSP